MRRCEEQGFSLCGCLPSPMKPAWHPEVVHTVIKGPCGESMVVVSNMGHSSAGRAHPWTCDCARRIRSESKVVVSNFVSALRDGSLAPWHCCSWFRLVAPGAARASFFSAFPGPLASALSLPLLLFPSPKDLGRDLRLDFHFPET